MSFWMEVLAIIVGIGSIDLFKLAWNNKTRFWDWLGNQGF